MAACSFKRDHHQRIAKALVRLDPGVLDSCGCLFAGGTAIALTHGEFRESVDIDFLISDMDGYRQLRDLVTSSNSLDALLNPGRQIELLRDIRTSQYKIEAMLKVYGAPIKFEIVYEGYISLDRPEPGDRVCGIKHLSAVDMLATKLMANSDRLFADETRSRDVIDMAMMRPTAQLAAAASKKVQQTVYKNDFVPNLHKAINRVRERDGWLDTCMSDMKIVAPKAEVLRNLELLQSVFWSSTPPPPGSRTRLAP